MYDRVTLKLNVDPLILSALREDITSEDVSANSSLSVYDFVKCSMVTRFIVFSSYSITSSTGQWSEPMTVLWMDALTSLSLRLSDTQK